VSWLVTGGAGYIGSHVVEAFRSAGEAVIVLDDMSAGTPTRLPPDVPFVRAGIGDREAVGAALSDHDVEGIVHLAAKKSVEESVKDPLGYFADNVSGLLALLRTVVDSPVRLFLFSSSAAVYGTPRTARVDEYAPTRPESPYGETKLVGEWLVRDAGRAHGLRWGSLRYFNVVGAAAARLADAGAANLVPLAMRALREGRPPVVYGTDYPTPDGSCIRDYVGVEDVARAHVLAAHALRRGEAVGVLNLGRGEGASVLEVLAAIGTAAGTRVEYDVAGRRPGDAVEVVADPNRARQVLGWQAEQDLQDMIGSAWQAFQEQEQEQESAPGRGPRC
jgi:UDP-glucose 4-epimerase